MKKLRLLITTLLLLAPVAAATYKPVSAQCYFNCTTTTMIPGFPIESIAGGILLGLLLIILFRLASKGASRVLPKLHKPL